jgi:tetraacyldisaccharide 4'-kinase
MIARLLQQRGFHPAVLSRGYGGNSKSPVNVVSDGRRSLLNWEECGDEPVLMAAMLPGVPVLTGPERYRTGLAAVERFGADIVILDDAFQHRQLFRDIDIVLLDAKRHLGNGFLLPRGPLRESARSLRRAHILLVTGVSEEGGLPEETRGLPLFRGIHRPSGIVSGSTGEIETVEILRGEKIVAFSGIGNSETFRKGLTALGASVVSFLDFPDHHPYTSSDIDKLRSIAVACGVSRLVTTEKDAVRLTSFPEFQQETSMLRITMEISPCSEFQELLLSHLPVK